MKKKWIEMALMIIIFLFFTGTSLGLVIMGAKVYKRIEVDTQQQFNARTPITYIMMKIRQNDHHEGIQLRELEGNQALVLVEMIESTQYETWIYTHEGYLREVYIEAGSELSLADGDCVMPLEKLEITKQEKGQIHIFTQTSDGYETRMQMTLKAAGRGEKR